MSDKDVRWIQRYQHFKQAYMQLEKAVGLSQQRQLSELEGQGLIQAFEYTHELAWNTLKDFLENVGVQNLYGSVDSTREAFKRGLLEEGEIWMDMIKKRNLSSHTYNSDTAQEIIRAILNEYDPAFRKFRETLEPLALKDQP
jgi:nucleotidyltransferase substrate binding protein (TIGR01987 family)